MLDFGYFVLIWWQSDKKKEFLKAELLGLVYLGRPTNFMVNYQKDPIIFST